MKAAELAAKLKRVQKQGDGSFNVQCPAHKDGRPSCNIKDGDKGILMFCYAGCAFEAIRDGFIRDGNMEERTEYVPIERDRISPDWINPRQHVYRDAKGNAKYLIHRQPHKEGGKTFKQFRINDDGTLTPSMADVERIPYNLHLIHDQHTVIIVEGEQSADALMAAGYPATTNPGGSSKWQPELTPYFQGKQVVIIPDNDEPGAKHAANIAAALQGTAANTIIAPLCEGMADKADIVDWMQAHPSDISRIYDIALAGEAIRPSGGTRQWRTGADMRYVTETNWIIRDLYPGEGMGALYGSPGSGKTFFALDTAMSIACGKGWKTNQTKHGGVAYVALEGGALFDNRCLKWAEINEINLADHPFTITSDPLDLLVKGTESEVDSIIEYLGQQETPIKLIVIDTLNRAIGGGNENAAEDMGALVANCDRIWKALGCFLLVVHHSGKDAAKGLRGHSSLLGAVNTEIQITNLSGTDFKQAEVLKQRDGESGQMHMFNLQVERVANDSDGYEITTCIINHADGSEEVEAKATAAIEDAANPRGKHQIVIWTQLKALMQSKGEMVMPADGHPRYKCVRDDGLKSVVLPALDAPSNDRASVYQKGIDGLIKAERISRIGGYTWIR